MKTLIASIVIGVLVVVGAWEVLANGIGYITSTGEHTGYVSAVEKTGIFYKTGTAYIKTDPQSSQEDSYCIENPTVYQELVDASEQRELITAEYKDVLIMGLKNCNKEEGIITSISTSTQ